MCVYLVLCINVVVVDVYRVRLIDDQDNSSNATEGANVTHASPARKQANAVAACARALRLNYMYSLSAYMQLLLLTMIGNNNISMCKRVQSRCIHTIECAWL